MGYRLEGRGTGEWNGIGRQNRQVLGGWGTEGTGLGRVRDKGKGRGMSGGAGDRWRTCWGIVHVGHVHCVYKSVNLAI